VKGYQRAKSRVAVSVGESVRIVRELQELSQNELSTLTGIPQSTISAIEQDRNSTVMRHRHRRRLLRGAHDQFDSPQRTAALLRDWQCRWSAELLDVVPSTLTRLIRGRSAITPEMALRLSLAVGRSPESWLAMQHNYDLWQAHKRVNLRRVKKLDVDAA
jgi:antitoxin HigA-1